jgi:hypothetical protein
MSKTLVRTVGSSVAQGLMTGVWIAAGELPAGRRRAARFVASAAVAVVGWHSSAKSDGDTAKSDRDTAKSGRDTAKFGRDTARTVSDDGVTVQHSVDEAPRPLDRKRVALVIAAGALGVGAMVGRRRLENRWLDKLARDGHPHPHRALAVRMGLVSAGLALTNRLARPR